MASSRAKNVWKLVCLAVLAALAVGVSVAAFTNVPDRRADAAAFTPAPIPTKKPATVALWVGDSFTAGVGANGAGYSYAHRVSVAMGWVDAVDAQSGSGFVADGKNNAATNVPMPARLDLFTGKPQYVIVDGGRNDWNKDFTTETTPAIRDYLNRIHVKWPAAKIILVVPFNVASTEANPDFVNLYAEEAQRLDALVVNPVDEGWLNKATMAEMIFSDKVHPNRNGHQYIAEHLITRLKALGIKPVTSKP